MDHEKLLTSLESSADTVQGFQLLRSAAADAGDVGYLNHSSRSDNVLEYFVALRHEVHELLCTSSKGYAEQRKQMDRSGVALVSFLAGTIVTGAYAAPLALATPLAAVAIYVPLKLGVKAWCRVYKSSPNEVTPTEIDAGEKDKIGKVDK